MKADRSLSGRMVCGRCGRPLGPGRSSSRHGGLSRRGGGLRRSKPSLPLLLLGILGCGALLTAVVGGRPDRDGLWRSPDSNDPSRGESEIMFRNIAW